MTVIPTDCMLGFSHTLLLLEKLDHKLVGLEAGVHTCLRTFDGQGEPEVNVEVELEVEKNSGQMKVSLTV